MLLTLMSTMMSTMMMMVMIKCKRKCEVERQERRIAFSGGRLHRQTICAQLFQLLPNSHLRTDAKPQNFQTCNHHQLCRAWRACRLKKTGEKRDVMKTLVFIFLCKKQNVAKTWLCSSHFSMSLACSVLKVSTST